MKIKICGLVRVHDAMVAISLGATHVGIVLAPDSPRCATLAAAREIAAVARGCAETVLVFRSVDDEGIAAACCAIGVLRVQVQDADAARNARLAARGLLPVPVARLGAGATRLPRFLPPPSPQLPALLDGGAGGAGTTFAWSLLGEGAPDHVFVAGGITPDNIAELLRHQPWGLDVSSGVECAPGVKDEGRMRELFRSVRRHAEVSR